MGLWNFQPLNDSQMWNFILAVVFLVLSIVFFITNYKGIGFVMMVVFIMYVVNDAEKNVLSFFMDPIIFIVLIIILMWGWLRSPDEKKARLADLTNSSENTVGRMNEDYGGAPKDFESRIYDQSSDSLEARKRQWAEMYPNDPEGWRRFKN